MPNNSGSEDGEANCCLASRLVMNDPSYANSRRHRYVADLWVQECNSGEMHRLTLEGDEMRLLMYSKTENSLEFRYDVSTPSGPTY